MVEFSGIYFLKLVQLLKDRDFLHSYHTTKSWLMYRTCWKTSHLLLCLVLSSLGYGPSNLISWLEIFNFIKHILHLPLSTNFSHPNTFFDGYFPIEESLSNLNLLFAEQPSCKGQRLSFHLTSGYLYLISHSV
jgi:hypothetical protein